MKNRKIIAWGLVVSIGLAFLAGLMDANDSFFTLSGLGLIVFGIWASVVLFKYQD